MISAEHRKPLLSESHRFQGEELSWAGACPWNQGLCFATESGKLLIPDTNGAAVRSLSVVENDGPINGVAFSAGLVGVSTPNEIVLLALLQQSGELQTVWSSSYGAHDIAAIPTGGFVAPMGNHGILLSRLVGLPSGERELNVGYGCGDSWYFYKLIGIGQAKEGDLYACAARRDGLVTLIVSRHSEDADRVRGANHLYSGLDVVGVCSLGAPELPHSIAAVGIDGTILLSRNVMDGNPLVLHVDGLRGTAYTVISASGHLFVLTSAGVLVLPELISQFVRDRPLNQPNEIWELPIEAVEAYLAGGSTMLLVLDDGGALSFSTDQIASSTDLLRRESHGSSLMDPIWEPTIVKDFSVPSTV